MAAGAGALEYHLATRLLRAAAKLVRKRRGRCRGRRQIGRGGRWNAAYICGDRADVFRRKLAKTVIDRFAHGPGRGAVTGRMADREIGDEIVIVPGPDAGGLVRGDVEGAAAGGHCAGEFSPVVQSKGEIAG